MLLDRNITIYSASIRKLALCSRGGVSTYLAFFTVLAVAAGAVVLDLGRLGVARSQMQDRADAGAMAGAVALNGRDGARANATQLAMSAMAQYSGITSDQSELAVSTVTFYKDYENGVVAANDLESKTIEVVLEPRQINLFLAPVFKLFGSGEANAKATMEARSVASAGPYICHAPPLMICDFSEIDPSLDLSAPGNVGRQVRLKEPQSSSSAWAPGNFGLLSLPDGSSGADDIEGALAAVEPSDCYDIDVLTAQGSKTNKTKSGINARFDQPGNSWPYPAPNVITYPRDAELIVDPNAKLGSGNWDINGYWLARHGSATPAALAGASRFQVYLYELGHEFARNGKETLYPVPSSLPSGFVVVTPVSDDIPVDPSDPDNADVDGVPSQTVAPNGFARRVVQVAQLQCISDNVHGHGTYPTHGNYIEVFLTELVRDPPDAAIYGEVIRPLTALNSPEYHANVELLE